MRFTGPMIVFSAILLLAGCSQDGIDRAEPRHDQNLIGMNRSQKLIRRLDTLPVQGVSAGGPYVGIGPNVVTDAVVKEGDRIVPSLIAHLDRATYAEAVHSIYCLHELKAKSAKPKVQALEGALQRGERFANKPHDLTLKVEIEFFLREAESW
jgi:hypothetical protein